MSVRVAERGEGTGLGEEGIGESAGGRGDHLQIPSRRQRHRLPMLLTQRCKF